MFGTRRRRRASRLHLVLASALLTAARFAYCSDVDIQARDTIPAPISFNPAQNWEGIDGSWNTFTIRVGTPPQTMRVQISTASQQTWVVAPRGCQGISDPNCPDERGGLFSSNESSTWDPNGRFLLWTEENLGLEGDADYGWDVVTLGGPGEGGPTLKNMTVGGLGAEDFWFGHFGLDPKPTNFTSFNDPSPSYMTTLKDNSMIPSVSWGYTAGAPYRFTKVLASLTLGGYDSSRFIPNDLSFDFASDNERDIVVAIQKISSTNGATTHDDLLPNAVYAYIDSTVPHIWLPIEACRAFEAAFNLTYDNSTELYLLSNDQHKALQASNPNVTFTLAAGLTGGATIQITLPYAAFDLQATPPYNGLIEQSNYFPLRRAANETQYTLGRTFLQEAYLFVDWERETFNVSQCAWEENMTPLIVPVRSVNDTSGDGISLSVSAGRRGIALGAIIGIAVGVAAVAIAGAVFLFFFVCRRRRKSSKHVRHEKLQSPEPSTTIEEAPRRASREAEAEATSNVYPKIELDANQQPRSFDDAGSSKGKDPHSPTYEGDMGGSTLLTHSSDTTSPGTATSMVPSEIDSKPREIYEMPGDFPAPQEAGGRQLSEKESMMVREARYNGLDPRINPPPPIHPPPPSTPGSGHAPSPLSPLESRDYVGVVAQPPPARQRRHISPGDVIELSPFERDNLTMQLVSPIGGPPGANGTFTFSPVSSHGAGSATMSSGGEQTVLGDDESAITERQRRRFSYE